MDQSGRFHDEIDFQLASAVRVQDYVLGGIAHFAVDRLAAEKMAVAVGGFDQLRAIFLAHEVFLEEVVWWLVEEAGVRQFLHIGCGVPRRGQRRLHHIAQQAAPDSRVVYVDADPIVLAHAHELVKGCTPEGAVTYVHADIREPALILERANETLDLEQSVGLLLASVLHFVANEDELQRIVGRLIEAVSARSYLVVSHLTGDPEPEVMKQLAEAVSDAGTPFDLVIRSRDAVAGLFLGLEMVGPRYNNLNRSGAGATSMKLWLPEAAPADLWVAGRTWWCGVARQDSHPTADSDDD